MISSKDLFEIKKQEWELLAPYAGNSYQTPRYKTYLEYQNAKPELAKMIKAHTVQKNPTATNQLNQRFKVGNLEFDFNYQREGNYIHGDKGFEDVFFIKHNPAFFFTSSGQAANSVCLFGLSQLGNLKLHPESTVWYYETRRLYEKIVKNDGEGDSLQVLFLDSSQSVDASRLDKDEVDLFIIDTTCFPIMGSEMEDLVDRAHRISKPVILTRSHLKLDTMGLDYENLGSIVIFNAEKFDGIKEREIIKFNPKKTKLENYLQEVSGYIGASFYLDNFYPFLGDKKLFRLNLDRVNRLRENCSYIAENVKLPDNGLCTMFETPHKLFFHVGYKGTNHFDAEMFKKLNYLHELNAKYCDSFGFDFMAHNNLISYFVEGEDTHVRFSAPDYSSEDLDKAIELLNTYFKKILI